MNTSKPRQQSWRKGEAGAAARHAILRHIQDGKAGDYLPTFDDLAQTIGCSIAPVRKAMEEMSNEGLVSLSRGRPAKIAQFHSLQRTTRLLNGTPRREVYNQGYDFLGDHEADVAEAFKLRPTDKCIKFKRVHFSDDTPIAFHTVYLNPGLFKSPGQFLDVHDVKTESLAEIYKTEGFIPSSMPATLSAALANDEEQRYLALTPADPVLRNTQLTRIRIDGAVHVLEYLYAVYHEGVRITGDRQNIEDHRNGLQDDGS